ncbi:SLIT and NTRK-like protein 6 [Rhinophrynus dorsalis]
MAICIFLLYLIFMGSPERIGSELLSSGSCKTLCLCDEKDGILLVNCEEKGIINLSEINIPSSQYIDLNILNNGLFKLHVNEFSGFNSIIALHLGFNNIVDIEDGTFNNLGILKKLHINHNSLEILREDTFNGLENLEFLQADNNFITTIESNTFNKLTRLKVLILNDNAIESLPTNIFRFVPLTHLDLRGNQLKTLPYVGFLEHIGRIIELQLEDNRWVCNCDLLEMKVWLENMPQQSTVDEVVCYSPINFKGTLLKRLKKEMVCTTTPSNEFEDPTGPLSLVGTSSIINDHIPTKTTFLKSPTKEPTLYAPSKSPTLLPQLYCPIPCHCSSHTFSGNLIHCQERNIESLSDLGPPPQNPRKLFLAGNIIHVLHKLDFIDYGSLEMLHLGNNHIEIIEEQCFVNLTKLQKLYLNGNLLRSLNPGLFIGLKNVEYLYLEYNAIKEILPATFSLMTKLKVLYLNNNHIQTLPDHIFSGIPLIHLNLKSNQFSTFPSNNVLEELSALLQIELQDNPWDCTCNLIELKTWTQKQKTVTVSDILCSTPIELMNKDLKSVQKEILCPKPIHSKIFPTQSIHVTPSTTTNTVDTLLRSLSDSIPLSVLILCLLIILITTVLCSAGIIVLVLHRRRRHKKKQVNDEIRETSPVHIQYSMYGHKTTQHTTECQDSINCEQRVINPVIQVYQSPPFSPKYHEQEAENDKVVNDQQNCRSILEKENDSPLTGSNLHFRSNDQAKEFLSFQDATYLYKNMIEKENEIKQLGIAEYLRKNIAHLHPDIEVHYPRNHEDVTVMEKMMYSRPRKVLVEQTQKEYFELKANIHTEPDYLEVLEQRT